MLTNYMATLFCFLSRCQIQLLQGVRLPAEGLQFLPPPHPYSPAQDPPGSPPSQTDQKLSRCHAGLGPLRTATEPPPGATQPPHSEPGG